MFNNEFNSILCAPRLETQKFGEGAADFRYKREFPEGGRRLSLQAKVEVGVAADFRYKLEARVAEGGRRLSLQARVTM